MARWPADKHGPAIAQFILGILYERTAVDEAGLSQAVDAYRKALFMSPESVDLRSILAVMLETLSEQYRRVNAPEKPRK